MGIYELSDLSLKSTVYRIVFGGLIKAAIVSTPWAKFFALYTYPPIIEIPPESTDIKFPKVYGIIGLRTE